MSTVLQRDMWRSTVCTGGVTRTVTLVSVELRDAWLGWWVRETYGPVCKVRWFLWCRRAERVFERRVELAERLVAHVVGVERRTALGGERPLSASGVVVEGADADRDGDDEEYGAGF